MNKAMTWTEYAVDQFSAIRKLINPFLSVGDSTLLGVKRLVEEKRERNNKKEINPAYVKELEEEVQAYRTALRPALSEKLEHPIVVQDLIDVVKKYKRMDRQLFLAASYNWNRLGLAWECAARDLFNYIQFALGKNEIPREEQLLPRKLFFSNVKLSIGGQEVNPKISLIPDFKYDVPMWPPERRQQQRDEEFAQRIHDMYCKSCKYHSETYYPGQQKKEHL